MRPVALAVVMLLVAAGAEAAWEEYVYLDRGVAIQFPAKPQLRTESYPSMLIKGLPAAVYSATDDNVLYRLTVVDLGSRVDAGTNLLNEAAYFPARRDLQGAAGRDGRHPLAHAGVRGIRHDLGAVSLE